MSIFSIFTLFGGLAFFIYGMNQMSGSLERIAGDKMERVINKMTENRLSGLLMGCFITIAIQSSSAVTVMLVGLVNSGLMNIGNTVAVIMGSNIGTTITAWLLSLVGLSSDNIFIKMLKPESFSPILAFIGIGLFMISKRAKRKDIGNSFIGFAILMYGMIMMSDSVEPLAQSPDFANVMATFNNPILAMLAGTVVTAIIQSSAASVGMLQALSVTGNITYGMAIPIIMGQNIGTCATAILSSIGVNRNAKRVAVIHLSFNLIGTTFFMLLYFGLHTIFDFEFVDKKISPMEIAMCHSIFNIATTILLLPFSNLLVKIATKTIKTEPAQQIAFLDERLFLAPSVAIVECDKLSNEMADMAKESVDKTVANLFINNSQTNEYIAELENKIDVFEDRLGSYLVRFSGKELSVNDSRTMTRILYSIGNLERISDHALALTKSASEIAEKNITMSESAERELKILGDAVSEIISLTSESYKNMNTSLAAKIEPLEQVIDSMVVSIRQNHIARLQNGYCTIEKGFILADILTNYERISDHCSNIAIAVIEADSDIYDPHEYLKKVKVDKDSDYIDNFNIYRQKYLISLEK
ncbi:MAG: Na/Pi cotransporter family protein [Eubacterium sp.]|nr:Na/Pi cotransporter family protein [Eubacterium sp.]